ncbi:uncharacterized protein EDB91DRAFT_1084462 [Suillus paluster]|uniref:uncharacterized protein n=1 Tax=Suillus paluster TaxID=48578 RepID=UPI001B85C7E2|nr:uncharacterized protein EDB91DRAFT_1084462 [Suillus paluster]KAG1733409.1 hypothetical protein EDB91DRAFT_1084462 [Suillus paluster]
MRGSKVQEWTPTSNIHLVEWKKTVWTRKATGKWVERPKIRKIQSVPATPTKSSSKQWPSEDMLFLGGDDWVGDLNQQDFIPLPLPTSMLVSRVRMTIFGNGSQGPIDISAYSLSEKLLLTGLASFVGPMVSTNVTTASDGAPEAALPLDQSMDRWFLQGLLPGEDWSNYGVDDADEGFFAAADTDTDTDTEHATTPTANASKNNHDLSTGVPFIKNDKTMTTIVDKSGVHTHIIKYCMCADAPSADLQLFRLGLFPASFTQPKTTFTFDVLDDFLLDNLECGTSAMNYYSFGHEEKDVEPGDLALFCLACPQPGINVTLPTEEGAAEINRESDLETLSWLYSRSLVMDGNFKAEHMHAANPIDEVPLMDGRGFMVGDGKYKAHLALAKDACSTVRVQQSLRSESSQCIPSQTGGNRHWRMCLCKAWLLRPTCNGGFSEGRKLTGPYLQIQEQMEIILGIGLWHVHGHQDSCYVRYASNFIAGATRIDGEIMETLWAPLNIISPSARGMGTPHRKECLDYQMNDCNFMKMIRMRTGGNRRGWHRNRRSTDPKAMDIYEVQLQKAPTRKEQELRLLEENGQQPAPARRRGAATWLAEGLSIEEAQEARAASDREPMTGDRAALLFELEKVVIPLPSNLGQGRCTELGAADMIHQEHVLREGQANDALHNIRVHLADKAVIFRKTVRTAKSQAKSTRAWAQIHAVDRANISRSAPPSPDPNARGQRNSMLAWFWSMDVEGDSDSSDWLNEFYQVHWLRAKALRDRWEEEMLLVQHEMNWTYNFFLHKAEQWILLATISKAADKVGHLAYAARQCKMYQRLYEDSRDAFEVAKAAWNPMHIMPAVL